MTRDPNQLDVFQDAHQLVLEVYRMSSGFPLEERFGLQQQIRRAAVSVPANITEGCARPSEKDFAHFLAIALGSASEVRYFLRLCRDLGYVSGEAAEQQAEGWSSVIRRIQRLMDRFRELATTDDRRPRTAK